MKKTISLFLTLVLCLTLFSPAALAQTVETDGDGPANSWRYVDGELFEDPYAVAPLAEPYHPDATLLGIDVSEHQGRIDWERVKASEVDFAIIRCGYGGNYTYQDDDWFLYNATECERLNIPYGVYLYSYATDITKANNEANHALRLLEGRTLSYPVYLDMEDNSTLGSDFAAIATTFCNRLLAAGYAVGVYANLYWWNTHLTDPCFDNWHRWVAQYNTACHYTGTYAMWQYSSGGSVPGINGRVDMNFQIGWPADHGAGDPNAPTLPDSPADREGVLRLFGQNRYETSFRIADECKAMQGVEKFDTVIIASGSNFADALAGSYLAYVKKAPILLSGNFNDRELCTYIDANLADNGQVYILGGEAAIPTTLDAALHGHRVKRLAGSDRFETNILILKESGVTDEDILVCTAFGFADSLSASAVKRPILLVDSNSGQLNSTQQAYLSALHTHKYYVLGGTSAVGEELAAALQTYGSVERIGGTDRFETSVLIARKFFTAPKAALLAYSQTFPDGLCGGPLATAQNAPLLLAKTDSYVYAKAYAQANRITDGVVLGGPTLISDTAAKAIFQTDTILLPE